MLCHGFVDRCPVSSALVRRERFGIWKTSSVLHGFRPFSFSASEPESWCTLRDDSEHHKKENMKDGSRWSALVTL